MTEIDAQADLLHPANRVWHALTDLGLLARWFTEVEPMAGQRDRILLFTAGMPGFDAAVDAEVADRREPELIALRCLEGGRRSRLTCEVVPTADGSRLSVREVLEHGSWTEEQRASREESYQQALTGRLPAILDWLAFRQVDLRRGEAGMTVELPAVAFGDTPAPSNRRRPLLVAGLAGVVLAAGAGAWAVLPGDQESVAGPDGAPTPSTTAAASPTPKPPLSARPTRTATSPTPRPSRTPTAKPSRTATSSAPPASAVTARYETVSTRLLGFTGEVVVENPGGTAAKGWTVVVTLAEGGTVTEASGADWRQEGQAVTFTGPPVPAGRSRTFTFAVRDGDLVTKAPEGCSLGGEPCAGL